MFDSLSRVLRVTVKVFKTTNAIGNRLFGVRPEDIEAERRARNQRNRDIYYEVKTRRERQRRGWE